MVPGVIRNEDAFDSVELFDSTDATETVERPRGRVMEPERGDPFDTKQSTFRMCAHNHNSIRTASTPSPLPTRFGTCDRTGCSRR